MRIFIRRNRAVSNDGASQLAFNMVAELIKAGKAPCAITQGTPQSEAEEAASYLTTLHSKLTDYFRTADLPAKK
jgi:hypothetical protein